jgi:ribonuclease G
MSDDGTSPGAEIFVNVGPRETRAALLESGALQELQFERASRRGLVGNLYKGRVSRVLPGMQAAFVDIGLERTAFLHVADIALARPDDTIVALPAVDDIRRLVSEGDEILVQVVKDPIGTKGARLTTFVALPARYLVYLPRGDGVGVSARIEEESERLRLKASVTSLIEPGAAGSTGAAGGYIVRTAAQGASSEGLREDMDYLAKLWHHVRSAAAGAAPGTIVHEDLPLALRVLRDELPRGVGRVLVDCPREHARMTSFAATFLPEAARIELYSGSRPIFDLHGIEEEVARALDRKVPLKSGGHLVIEQTEAMTTIDVNTGAYVGHRNLEETIFRTNLEAAVAIARQLRLRNLGGIIIIDFIDMLDEAHRRQVLAALERALAGDRAQTRIASLSPLGLVEMTRKRTRESLQHLLCAPCPSCEGRGFVRTAETTCQDIFRDIVRQSRQFASRELLVLAHQDVVDLLLSEESAALAELTAQIGRPIRLQVEALYGADQYDVVLI